MQFEATRADRDPDVDAIRTAETHAREAVRLNPNSGEAWATLGFVLGRTDHRGDALAALRRATTTEPGVAPMPKVGNGDKQNVPVPENVPAPSLAPLPQGN